MCACMVYCVDPYRDSLYSSRAELLSDLLAGLMHFPPHHSLALCGKFVKLETCLLERPLSRISNSIDHFKKIVKIKIGLCCKYK